MILTKEVEVRLNTSNIKYYEALGYEIPKKKASKSTRRHTGRDWAYDFSKTIMVKIEDLPLRSSAYIVATCDYCGKEKPSIKYSDYNTETKNGTEKCCCLDCAHLKREETMLKRYGYSYALQNPKMMEKVQRTNMERYGSVSPSGNEDVKKKMKETFMNNYGVECPSKSKEIREKIKQTNLERYGVENPSENNEIKEKIKKTNLDRYGFNSPMSNEEIKKKRDKTMLDKYGVLKPLQNEEIRQKCKQTNMERYGVENVSQLEEVKQKVSQTNLENCGYKSWMQSPEFLEKWFAKNGSNFVRTSRQQEYLCEFYNGILNHPFKCFALDIFLSEDNLDIEFDGSGHKMSVTLGTITSEDFDKKELYRNVAIKSAGYKQMRIISIKDYLPSDEILLQMLEHTRKYFSDYPNHSWIEFNIDSSTVLNSEQKDGIFFNFGELRKLPRTA